MAWYTVGTKNHLLTESPFLSLSPNSCLTEGKGVNVTQLLAKSITILFPLLLLPSLSPSLSLPPPLDGKYDRHFWKAKLTLVYSWIMVTDKICFSSAQ